MLHHTSAFFLQSLFFFVSVRSLGKTSAWEGYLPCPILLDRTVFAASVMVV